MPYSTDKENSVLVYGLLSAIRHMLFSSDERQTTLHE